MFCITESLFEMLDFQVLTYLSFLEAAVAQLVEHPEYRCLLG